MYIEENVLDEAIISENFSIFKLFSGIFGLSFDLETPDI